jgi:hypothetical protein
LGLGETAAAQFVDFIKLIVALFESAFADRAFFHKSPKSM